MIYVITEFIKSLFIRGFLLLIVLSLFFYFFTENILNSFIEYKMSIIILISIIFLDRIYFYSRYHKYISLSYALNLHNIFKNKDNTRSLFIDKFKNLKKKNYKSVFEKVILKDLDNFEVEYNNFVFIDIEKYRQNKEYILHFLKLKNYELKVYATKSKSVILSFFKLPNYYNIDFSFFKKKYMFLGIYEKGLYYKRLNELDHLLCVGESGSGKSNFMQLLNINFLYNLEYIKKMYMVDLKGGVELKRYETKDNIEFVSDIQKLDLFLDDILIDLKNTQNEMLENNTRKLNKFTFLIFDEIGAISVYPDRKLRDSIFDKIALISMQGRASGILLFLFAQKIDNTILPSSIVNNLQSRVLLKTSNDYNINIIDLKENIRERITATEVQDFIKGRAIIKDGLTSEKNIIQFPYISDSFLNQSLSVDFSNLK